MEYQLELQQCVPLSDCVVCTVYLPSIDTHTQLRYIRYEYISRMNYEG